LADDSPNLTWPDTTGNSVALSQELIHRFCGPFVPVVEQVATCNAANNGRGLVEKSIVASSAREHSVDASGERRCATETLIDLGYFIYPDSPCETT
jgi:hypothetical protein